MIAALMTLALAADPVALRMPTVPGGASAGVLGTAISVAVRPASGPAFGIHAHPRSFLGTAVGWQGRWIGAQRAWGIELASGGGVDALLAGPGVALAAHGAIHGGVQGDRGRWMTGLVMPLGLRLDRVELVVPTLFESQFGLRAGPVWLGLLGQMGPVFVPGGPPALHAKGGLFLVYGPREP